MDRQASVPPVELPKLVRPSWADPGWCVAANDVQITELDGANLPNGLLAPSNPRRWAIGFKEEVGTPTTMRAIPSGDQNTYGWLLTGLNEPLWLTMFQFGPIVQREWYLATSGAGNVTLYEIVVM